MGREQKNIYCFIFDENRNYYRARQSHDGSYTIIKDTQSLPIQYNPVNLLNSKLEFGTNQKYLFLARSINYPLQFIKDGAAILRSLYYFGKGVNQKLFFSIIEWDGRQIPGRYELSYTGRIDFSQKDEDPESGSFTVPLVDESAWGVLSRFDTVEYAFDCSPTNPKAVKVLVDGITLINTYTYQTVQSDIRGGVNDTQLSHVIPFVLVNQDGDSSGIISKSQSYSSFPATTYTPPNDAGNFIETIYDLKQVNISGSFKFKFYNSYADPFRPYDSMRIFFSTNYGKRTDIFKFGMDGGEPASKMINGKIYDVPFDFNWDLDSGEKISFACVFYNTTIITPIVTNIKITTKTVAEPEVVYGLRAGDLMQQIVSRATNNKFTIDSNFLKIHNKDICISGDALRSIPNAELYTSFEDFFQTFNSLYWMALMNINGSLWMESAAEVYRTTGRVTDMGEALKVNLSPAMDMYANEIQVGSPDQDLNHPSGRYEFNSTNTFSLDIQSSDSKLDLVTKYITGCYAIMFLMLDYKGGSSKDDKGDKSVYLLRITDELGTAVDNIETFENITIDSTLLQPLIKSPINNAVITNNKPNVHGVGIVGNTVHIYADTVLDGSTVVGSDGKWSYDINTALSSYDLTHTGIHTIDVTYTDLLGVIDTSTVTINTSSITATDIIYPAPDDNLYNNMPLIRGIAQAGQNVNLTIDGVFIATIVSDNSGTWEYKSTALSNGNHTASANGVSVTFYVDTNVSHPLITYVGSELDGLTVINNLPLIQGVAQPHEEVKIWLNYISYTPLGTVRADANGNWSFQVVPISYIDPVSGTSIILAPIQSGLNIFSTSLDNYVVGINVKGYKLERPVFNSITGVPDNTIFNTAYSPKRMLKNHYTRFAAMLKNQPQEFLYAQKFGKNGNLTTVLGTEIVSERADVSSSELGSPFAILEYATVKIKALKTFIQTLYDFSSGNILKFSYRGRPIFCLPIGGMKLSSIIDTEQEWKLLISTLTSYIDLFDLYKKGTKITVMKKALYRSDRNSLHFVEYDYQPIPNISYKTIYQDWFNSRNSSWSLNPYYVQKYQTNDPVIVDQITTNGLFNITLRMYRCADASFVDVIDYSPVNPAPIAPPEVVMEAKIDFSKYPPDTYFFVMLVGSQQVMISEKIETRIKWNKTILINAGSSLNETGAFYSTGFRTIIRVEGIIKKLQPRVNIISASDDVGNNALLYSNSSRGAEMRFGTAYGLPDYLYLKIADCVILDDFYCENNPWVIPDDEKISPSEQIDGQPLYYYTVNMMQKFNIKGATVAGADSSDLTGVVLVVNPTALGLPIGSLINIELDNG